MFVGDGGGVVNGLDIGPASSWPAMSMNLPNQNDNSPIRSQPYLPTTAFHSFTTPVVTGPESQPCTAPASSQRYFRDTDI